MFEKIFDTWLTFLDWVFSWLPGEEVQYVLDEDEFVQEVYTLELEEGDYRITANVDEIEFSRRWWWPFYGEGYRYGMTFHPEIPLGMIDGQMAKAHMMEIVASDDETMFNLLQYAIFRMRTENKFYDLENDLTPSELK